jgi:hypothetical protein
MTVIRNRVDTVNSQLPPHPSDTLITIGKDAGRVRVKGEKETFHYAKE